MLALLAIGEVVVLKVSGLKIHGLLPPLIFDKARSVDHLFYVILGVTAFFFLLTEGLLVYSCIRFRARAGGGAAAHTHGHRGLELAWTLFPGLILIVLALLQSGAWGELKVASRMPRADDPRTVVVEVLAKQYEWNFRLAGKDGRFGTKDDVVRTGVLHVPVGRPIRVELQSMDVIHSFFLPNARLKQDVLPGMTIPQWFEADRKGTYPIVCAELCGVGHTTMKGLLVAESEKDFEAWMARSVRVFPAVRPEDDPIWKHWKTGAR